MKYFLSPLILFLFFCLSSFSQNDTNAVNAIHKKLKVFQANDQIDSIWVYENKAFEISKKINYEYGIAHALSAFGVIYKIRGDYPKSLDNFLKALSYYEKSKNKYRILVQFSGIATVYYFQKEFTKSKNYYLKAIQLSKELGNKRIESDNLNNLAILYGDLSEYSKAEECLINALKIDKEMDNKIGVTHELGNLSELYITMNKPQEALIFANQALIIATEIDYHEIMPSCYMMIGNIYSKLNKNKEAEYNFMKALAISNQMYDLQEKMKIESSLSEFYSKMGKNDQALLHYKKQILYRDSMYNEENTKKIVATEMNYEFDKIQAVTKFENDKVVYKLEADNKLHVQQRVFLILFIIIAIALLIFAKRAFDNKKRIAEFMASENNRKEVLLQEVHHRINNNLQIISSLLTLQANSADDEKLHNYLKQSQNRIQSLSALHELLYQNDSPLQIKMNDYLNKVLDFHRDVLNTLPNKVDIKLNITDASFPTKMAVPIALIVNELVTNSIKYAFNDGNNGRITISLLPFEDKIDKWVLHVSDTGKGLPTDTNFRKDSLGLRLVTIMAKQIKGDLIKSNVNGANFDVIFSLTA